MSAIKRVMEQVACKAMNDELNDNMVYTMVSMFSTEELQNMTAVELFDTYEINADIFEAFKDSADEVLASYEVEAWNDEDFICDTIEMFYTETLECINKCKAIAIAW